MKRGSINPQRYRARIGNCLLCGKEYRAVKDFKEHKQKWCSKECWNKRATVINKCLVCGNEIKTYKSVNKRYCNFECRDKGMVGRKLNDKHISNISSSLKGKLPKNHWQSGDKHPNWKEDRNQIGVLETPEYKELRLKILKRDDYSCQECGIRGGKGVRPILHLHHIKARKNHPDLTFDENNCIILCIDCHKKTESYLNRW